MSKFHWTKYTKAVEDVIGICEELSLGVSKMSFYYDAPNSQMQVLFYNWHKYLNVRCVWTFPSISGVVGIVPEDIFKKVRQNREDIENYFNSCAWEM